MNANVTPQTDKHALVLSGGGARAAYQVGCLRYIANHIPDYRPKILTGVSAGAINAAHLAASRDPWPQSVEKLRELWLSLDTNRVYNTELRSLLRRVVVWGLRLMSGGRLGRADLHGMVDNGPLRDFLYEHLPMHNETERLAGIAENLAEGLLESLAIVTTNYGSGRSVAWVEAADEQLWIGGQMRGYSTRMSLDHVMASAALPMFFPAVKLESVWHGDGGIRLTAPLSPALHLGATRILAVSPRAKPTMGLPPELREPYPSPAQIAGVMLNAVFLDMLDYDALQMNRINQLVSKVPEDERGDFRQVEVMVLRPREDLGALAREHEINLPRSFRFFESGLNNNNSRHSDALSMVIFEPEYLSLLIRLGEEDAAARHDEIESFLHGEACALPVW
jgi:NTE family protein